MISASPPSYTNAAPNVSYERTTGNPPPQAQPQSQSPPPQSGVYMNPEKAGSGELPQQPYQPYQQNPNYTQPSPPPAAAPPFNQQTWAGYGGAPPPGNSGPMPNVPGGGMYPQYTGGPNSPPGTFNGHHPGSYHQNSYNSTTGGGGMPGMQQQAQWTGQMGQMGPQPPMGYGGAVGQPMPMMYGVTLDQQCAQQGHIITSRFGIVGILSAIFLFPCGIIVCFMDQTEKCERCHQVFKHGILD
ncbi:hypothetical protein FRB96_008298 [Tulasnella sp. 330]|nr:hypothetical protein FRB96_008298 [Tulasnella sp. 330]